MSRRRGYYYSAGAASAAAIAAVLAILAAGWSPAPTQEGLGSSAPPSGAATGEETATATTAGIGPANPSPASDGGPGGDGASAPSSASQPSPYPSPAPPPKMMLAVLEGSEDSSSAVAQYEPDGDQVISLPPNSHIRFEPSDYRPADSMRVIARDLGDGTVDTLRKSYNVNNEFFVNLEEGRYQLQVQASWGGEAGSSNSHVYRFNVEVGSSQSR